MTFQANFEDDLIAELGPAFLAHILRRVSDRLVDAEAAWHEEVGLASSPRASSTLLALARIGPLPVTGLARRLRQSHQLVQQWVGKLKEAGLVKVGPDPADARRTIVALTPKGRRHIAALDHTLAACERATQSLLAAVAPDLERQVWALERALASADYTAAIRKEFRQALSNEEEQRSC